jgi:hypothetical protein
MSGFYDDYELRWRAAGNRSRIVIDTNIKVGDRVMMKCIFTPAVKLQIHRQRREEGERWQISQFGHLLPRTKADDADEQDLKRRAKAVTEGPRWRDGTRTLIGTVTGITYAGTFEGYVHRGGSEPWPTFAKWTTIEIDCSNGVGRSSYLDGVVKL